MDGSTYSVSPAAVVFPMLAFITLVIDVPPLVWHIGNRNLSAASLVFWIVLGNLMNFVNALIWPNDDIQNWWHGEVLCDIEVKIMVAGYIGSIGSLVSVMRNLAKALDVQSSSLRRAGARQRRQTVIDCLLCFGAPTYMAMIHYVVQPSRYYIFAISGCTTSFDNSWPKLVLVFIWPLVFCLIAVYYSVLVILRMRRYRRNFSEILVSSNSSLTKKRFLRLFLMSMALIVIALPLEIFILYENSNLPFLPYSWDLIHGPDWGNISLVPTAGAVTFDRWIQVGDGFLVFLAFGIGEDAMTMYREWLLKIGLGRIFPTLHPENRTARNQSHSTSSQTSSMGSRARLFIAEKFSTTHNNEHRSRAPIPTHSFTEHQRALRLPSTNTADYNRVSDSTATLTRFSNEYPHPPQPVHDQLSWLTQFHIHSHIASLNRQASGNPAQSTAAHNYGDVVLEMQDNSHGQ